MKSSQLIAFKVVLAIPEILCPYKFYEFYSKLYKSIKNCRYFDWGYIEAIDQVAENRQLKSTKSFNLWMHDITTFAYIF